MKVYAVVSPKGKVFLDSISYQQNSSIWRYRLSYYFNPSEVKWEDLKKLGYTCQKFELKKVKP